MFDNQNEKIQTRSGKRQTGRRTGKNKQGKQNCQGNRHDNFPLIKQ